MLHQYSVSFTKNRNKLQNKIESRFEIRESDEEAKSSGFIRIVPNIFGSAYCKHIDYSNRPRNNIPCLFKYIYLRNAATFVHKLRNKKICRNFFVIKDGSTHLSS